MIAQPNFDSRTKDLTISTKLNEFIKANADSDKPFFAYYGMRFGHGPFNSQEKFRNTTEMGIVGEMIAEADEMVGKLFKTLEERKRVEIEISNPKFFGWLESIFQLFDNF